ncbi:hypothetical protein WDW37_20385 [Bdellovibrionota bacterium FG-1]
MKKVVLFLGVLSSLISANFALAADETTVSVSCRDAREELRDAGYAVTITTGGIAGMTLATVSEQTIAGPRVLETVIVKKNNRGMERVYSGNGFKLTITLESMVPTATHPAKMFLRQITEGDIAVAVNADLICKINE